MSDYLTRATQLKAEATALQTQAATKAAKFKDSTVAIPVEELAEVQNLLGQADEKIVQSKTFKRLADGDLSGHDGAPSAAELSWRDSAPGEGNVAFDSKSWRSKEVDTPFGKINVRYNVPLCAQHKDYASAWEAYMRKGYQHVSTYMPNDRKTLTEGTDNAGGFTVPEDFQAELIKKTATMSSFRPNARVVNTSRDIVKWPRVNYASASDDSSGLKYTSGARLIWTGESPASSSTIRATDPVFGQIDIPVNTAMMSMPLSMDLIEDSAFDIVGYASDLFGEASALGENDAFWNGSGIGRPMGLLTQIDVAGTTGPSSTSVATTPTGDSIIGLFYDVPAQYRTQSKFYMNSATMKAVEKIKDSQNRYLISSLIQGSLATGQFDTIKGKPVVLDEFVPDIATNAYPIVFGNLQGYIIADRVQFSIKRSDELYMETNLTILVGRKRVGGMVAEPYKIRVQKTT